MRLGRVRCRRYPLGGQSSAKPLRPSVRARHTHTPTKGCPTDRLTSRRGYGAIPESRRQAARRRYRPGPGSGKLATCLSPVYHDHRLDAPCTPSRDLPDLEFPLRHPVNVATRPRRPKDFNLIDPSIWRLRRGQSTTIATSRPSRYQGHTRPHNGDSSIYRSPTEMGVNRAGFAIVDTRSPRGREQESCSYLRCSAAHDGYDRQATLEADLLLKVGISPSTTQSCPLPVRRRPRKGGGLKPRNTSRGRLGPTMVFCGPLSNCPEAGS